MKNKLEIHDIVDAWELLKSRPYFHFDEIAEASRNLNADSIAFGVDFSAGRGRTVVAQAEICEQGIYRFTGIRDIKTDCKYYSGSHRLFCAVNTSCENCTDYCPVRSDS